MTTDPVKEARKNADAVMDYTKQDLADSPQGRALLAGKISESDLEFMCVVSGARMARVNASIEDCDLDSPEGLETMREAGEGVWGLVAQAYGPWMSAEDALTRYERLSEQVSPFDDEAR